MVLTPLIRGLLVSSRRARRRLTIAPHSTRLGPVAVENVPMGRRANLAGGATRRRDLTLSLRPPGQRPLDHRRGVAPALRGGAGTRAGARTDALRDVHASLQAQVADSITLSVSYQGGWSIVPPGAARDRRAVGGPRGAQRAAGRRGGAAYVVALEGTGRAVVPIPDPAPDGVRSVTVSFPPTGANADGYTATTFTSSPAHRERTLGPCCSRANSPAPRVTR